MGKRIYIEDVHIRLDDGTDLTLADVIPGLVHKVREHDEILTSEPKRNQSTNNGGNSGGNNSDNDL